MLSVAATASLFVPEPFALSIVCGHSCHHDCFFWLSKACHIAQYDVAVQLLYQPLGVDAVWHHCDAAG